MQLAYEEFRGDDHVELERKEAFDVSIVDWNVIKNYITLFVKPLIIDVYEGSI